MRRPVLLPASLGLLLSSCAPPAAEAPPPQVTAPTPTPIDPAALPRSAYDPRREGFVVHEWGTLTSVRASDGTLLPGLHHEEEDLPGFVADRLAQAKADPSLVVDPTHQKMETPVTYFYSPEARTVKAQVGFPQGMLTQWYPLVREMWPPVYTIDGQLTDRYVQSPEAIPKVCQYSFAGELRDGRLDWGEVQIQPPAQSVPLPGPLGATSWGFARNTAANPLRVVTAAGEQFEKFLFYRGLGNFELPLKARFSGGDVVVTNTDPGAAMGGLVLMVVTREAAGFVELGDLPAGAVRQVAPPEATQAHPAFVAALKTRLAALLVKDGLYTDEAVAMVDTWERAYFLTPGLRLLYLLPQVHTDRLIPLRIEPAPALLSRTMVIRTELLSPDREQALRGWLADLGDGAPAQREAARAAFLQLGRFAEPLLTRALGLAQGDTQRAAAEGLLAQVRGQRRWAPLAAE